MASTPSFGTLENTPEVETPKSSTLFRIVLLGDFSGRANRGEKGDADDLAGRKLLKIDRENFDDILAGLSVTLKLPLPDDETAEISFAALDDFHPDQIFDKVEKFSDLSDSEEQTELMNSLMHHPDFLALESAWRGVDWLLRRVPDGSSIEVFLVDVTREEFAADLSAGDDLSACGLYKLLIEKATQGPKGKPWALFVGNYSFDLSEQDAELLGRMAKIARAATAPFLAAAPVQVVEKSFTVPPDVAETWEALRKQTEAAMLGLALPRFLLRQPYGSDTISIDKFSFEEFSTKPEGRVYVWCNPALGCAALLVQGFVRNGWGFKPGDVLDLNDLPLHTYTEDGDTEVTLTDVWLTTQMAQKAAKYGIMTLMPVKGKDRVQLSRFQTLALSAAAGLAGQWDKGAGVPKATGGKSPVLRTVMNLGAATHSAATPKATPAEASSDAPPSEDTPPSDDASSSFTDSSNEPTPESSSTKADPEMAALLASSETPAETPAEEPPAEMDPESAALMASMESGSSDTPS